MLKGVEPSVEEGVEKNNVDRCSCRGGIKEQSKRHKNGSSIDPPAIKKLLRVQELSRSIHLAVEDLSKLR